MINYPSIQRQKENWARAMVSSEYISTYSYEWGDPDSEQAKNTAGKILGNYKLLKNEYLLPQINGKTVIDIGCLDGKWVKFMDKADKVICVDITEEGYKKMDYINTQFYLTIGNELDGIPSGSVDFVFSMDSLVRSEKGVIFDYIKEIKRVLKPNGKACIHVPCSDQKLSRELNFTDISHNEILEYCHKTNFLRVGFDLEVINHGALLLLTNQWI